MLTPLELDIMKAVWQRAPTTVRDVQAAIRPARKLAYTTVMTMMDRLYHKGFLHRSLVSRAHLYEPAIRYDEVRDDALNTLIDSFFEGSRERLREFLRGIGQESAPARAAEVSVRATEVSVRAALDEELL